jgi:hypothetical protein
MSEVLLGWPNGVLGMVFGTLAGLLLGYRTWRESPWDLHDEHGYREPAKISFAVIAPSLTLLLTLLALMLGVGALDKGIWPPYALTGDFLGLLALVIAVTHLVRRVDPEYKWRE